MKIFAQILTIFILLIISNFSSIYFGVHYDSFLDIIVGGVGIICLLGAYDLYKDMVNKNK